jgi:hypothetical protein
LATSEVGDEVLVYDQTSHHVHHLNPACASVWQECDGRTAIASIAAGLGLSIDTVQVALGSLARANLLEGSVPSSLVVPGQSRRSFLRKATIAGSVALPAVVSVSAPTAAGTSSPGQLDCSTSGSFDNGCGCRMGSECASGNCDQWWTGSGTCIDQVQ